MACTCGHGLPHHKSGIRPGRCFACDCRKFTPSPVQIVPLADGSDLVTIERQPKGMPPWAAALVVIVCDRYSVKLPRVTWSVSRDGWKAEGYARVPEHRLDAICQRYTDTGYDWRLYEGPRLVRHGPGEVVLRVRKRRKANVYSSGRSWPSRIHVSAGTNITDQKLVLLHELAHYIGFQKPHLRIEHHDSRYWKLAFDLYEQFGPTVGVGDPDFDLVYAHNREKNHRKAAGREAARRRVGSS